jgi:NTP pyrophosphatase (non-canonical NTP hydrolase)
MKSSLNPGLPESHGRLYSLPTVNEANIDQLAELLDDQSRRLFSDTYTSDKRRLVHVALGLGGEIGEVLNIIKKVNRGKVFEVDPYAEDLYAELADVFIYALLMAKCLGVKPSRIIAEKCSINEARFDPNNTQKE